MSNRDMLEDIESKFLNKAHSQIQHQQEQKNNFQML